MTDERLDPETALLRLPKIIRDVEEDLFKHQAEADTARMRLKLREADLAEEIAKEAHPETGKPVHSNADARATALLRRLETDPEALARRRAVYTEEAVVARIKAVLQCHRDKQANARALVLSRSPTRLFFDAEHA